MLFRVDTVTIEKLQKNGKNSGNFEATPKQLLTLKT